MIRVEGDYPVLVVNFVESKVFKVFIQKKLPLLARKRHKGNKSDFGIKD